MDNSKFGISDIKRYTNVFTELEHQSILKYLERPKWRYGHVSSTIDFKNAPPFWSMTLIYDEFFTKHLLNRICKITGDDLELDTVYANGQTYGQSGQPHQDSLQDNERTFIYYPETFWDIRWNGKTVFMTNEGITYTIPNPNTAVYFPGIIKHYAEETARAFGGLRKTIAWKLRLK